MQEQSVACMQGKGGVREMRKILMVILICMVLAQTASAGIAVQQQTDGWEERYWFYKVEKLDNDTIVYWVDSTTINHLEEHEGVIFAAWPGF